MVIANKASLTQLKAFCEHFNWVFILLGGGQSENISCINKQLCNYL